jgi:hypothetical protein
VIPVVRAEEPPDFDARVRRRGADWLRQNLGAHRPPDYWREFSNQIATAFNERCAYSAMWQSSGTVDHFTSIDERIELAYEWSNYRWIAGWINSSKQSVPSDRLLDPFLVEAGWFRLTLPSLQLEITERVPVELREKAQFTIERLHLVHDERVIRQRRAWHEMYEKGTPLTVLHEKAPLIALAIETARADSS